MVCMKTNGKPYIIPYQKAADGTYTEKHGTAAAMQQFKANKLS